MVPISNELKRSSDRIGQLYPILLDFYGNIIDGQHRFEVSKKWRKVQLQHIRTEKDRLLVRLISNCVRRNILPNEKSMLLGQIGTILLQEGVEVGKIAYSLAEETGMSYRWVTKYLPDKFKDNAQSRRRTLVAYRATKINQLFKPPNGTIAIKRYGNADFVIVTLKKDFFAQLERKAKELGITPDVLIYNAVFDMLRRKSSALVSGSLY